MLLFQWGPAVSEERAFDLGLSRQFIVGAGADDDITQLHLTFWFELDDAHAHLGSGNRWCTNPSELQAFAELIREHTVFRAVGLRSDCSSAVSYECV